MVRRLIGRLVSAPAVLAALAVLVVAGIGLTATRSSTGTPLPARVAIHDALRGRGIGQALIGSGWSVARASPFDGGLERVSFLAGSRTVAEVVVHADGTTDEAQSFGRRITLGNWLAVDPVVLMSLSLLFALMLGVVPLWRLRNLDLLAVLSLVLTVPLFEQGYLSAAVLSVLPGMGYLLGRCVWRGLGPGKPRTLAPPGRSAHIERQSSTEPAVPVFDWLTRRWSPAKRIRVLRLTLATVALVLVMIGIGTPTALDVPYAVMEGATAMLHGLLPYGHMPGDIIHGDTYPILTYALYVPAAVIAPVSSTWDPIYLALAITALAALLIAAGLGWTVAGPRHRPGARCADDQIRGLRAATGWLAFPPLMLIVSTGTTDLVLGAMLLFAVLLWRRPAACTALLAVAGWFKLAPFALVPVWLAPRRGRSLLGALVALAAVSAGALALVVGLGGTAGVKAMVHAIDYQFNRGSLQSLWVALHIPGLQPVGQAVALSVVAGIAVEVWREPALAGDPRRLAACSAAILISLQVAANYWSVLYLTWMMPLVGLSLLLDAGQPSWRRPAPSAQRTVGVSSQPPSVEGVPALSR